MKKKPNYELKARVIKNGITTIQRKMSLYLYKVIQEDKIKLFKGQEISLKKPINEIQYDLYQQFAEEHPEEWKEAMRVNEASYKRTKRIKERIKDMLLDGQCIFLTLTFRNDVLESTTELTRHKYVARTLKKMAVRYVANIDYGKKNEREHYHAIVLADKVSCKDWPYGNLDIKRIRDFENCNVKLAKYINKLGLHAVKETTRQNRVIYSR